LLLGRHAGEGLADQGEWDLMGLGSRDWVVRSGVMVMGFPFSTSALCHCPHEAHVADVTGRRSA
jgi:hypothetical protein